MIGNLGSLPEVIRESGASSRKNLFFAVAVALAVTIGIVLALVLKK